MKNKKYILFDLDGTITDPAEGITKAVKYSLDKYNINVEDLKELNKFIGPPLRDSFIEFYNFDKDRAEEAVRYFREYFSKVGIYENYLYEGIEELLYELKREGKIIILATSKPTVFAKIILKHFNIDKYFDYVAGSTFDGTKERKADVIKEALKMNQIEDLDTAIMIGDRKFDIEGAKECGLDSIGVLYGYGDMTELKKCNPTYIVDTPLELQRLLLDNESKVNIL